MNIFVLSFKRMHKLNGYMDETHIFHYVEDLRMYLYNELLCSNPIIVTGIWKVE